MSNFYLVDQSLSKCAGHHFDYTLCVASETLRAGFNTIIGTNREFSTVSENTQAFGEAVVKPVFRNTTYCRLSHLPGLRMPTRSSAPPAYHEGRPKSRWQIRAQQYFHKLDAYLEQLEDDCNEFFGDTEFQSEDEVFFVTVSEIEWLAIARWIDSRRDAKKPKWHLQFHFELFLGRPNEYSKSESASRQVAAIFREAADLTQDVNTRFYTTSDELTDQYNHMDAAPFETLAYPVNPSFLTTHRTENQKLIVTCAGGIRREKGLKSYLPDLAESLCSSPDLNSNHLEIVVQGKPKNLPILQRKKGAEVIRWEPLPCDYYEELIYQTDIGLLMYDRQTFASRRSSVLGEYLSCGKPIVVSAGSWLHRQISKPIADYRKQLFDASVPLPSPKTISNVVVSDLQKHSMVVPMPGFRDGLPHRALNLRLDWSNQNPIGMYCAIDFEMLRGENQLDRWREIVSPDSENTTDCLTSLHVSVELPEKTTAVRIEFFNAFDPAPLELKEIEIQILESEIPIPTGVIGVPVANHQSIAKAIHVLAKHLEHYRQTAEENAEWWRSNHRPIDTLRQLLTDRVPVSRPNYMKNALRKV